MDEKSDNPVQSGNVIPPGMVRIWIELLTKAALCAATIGLIAGIAAAFFGS